MELPHGVDELSTPTAQRSHNIHDSAQENDFTYGAEYGLALDSENPTNWYGLFDGTAGLDLTMGGFQHNQIPQSNIVTTGSFDLPASTMYDVRPIAWFPVDQPINHHFYSNELPPPNYEQLVNPGIYAERSMMESQAQIPPLLVNRYQNTLCPTGNEFGSNFDTLNSIPDLNFCNDNGPTTYSELYTPSESLAESHSPNTTTSTPLGSKSQPSKKQRLNSRTDPKLPITVKKRKELTAALVSIPVRCIACKASRIACGGPPDCKRCQLTCIPGQMYTTIDLSEVLNFDKWLEEEYEQKRVYPPTHYLRDDEDVVAFLQHHVNGPELEVKCYYFEADPTDPSQTTIYWKEEHWKEAKTTAVSLTHLNYDLEPYLEKMVDIILDEACHGPYFIAKFFQDIWRFRKAPFMSLPLKWLVANKLLKKGWFISESGKHKKETLGNSVLYAEKAPWNTKIPAPATVGRQLDRMLELLVAKWEPVVCKGWQRIMEKQGKQGWFEMFYVGFLIVHILEQDAQRLKIHCEEKNPINDWKHPMKPRILVEKAIHFCNTFLTHFRGVSGMKHPLRLEWLPEDTIRLANGNEDIIRVVESLQEHRTYLKAKNLIGRKPCDTYKPGDDDSFNFTWSSCLLDETGRMIKMKDYLGKFN